MRIFESLRPTPELSFAVREYGCQAGINVTASHNPKEYNGYKVYWSDGAQLPPQHAAAIARELEHIDIFTGVRRMAYDDAAAQGLIQVMGRETDDRFMAHVMAMVNDRQSMARVADTFKMVYTPSTAAAGSWCRKALRGLGVKHLYCVKEQMVLDGNFPTVASPIRRTPRASIWPLTWPTRRGRTSSWALTRTATGWASWSAATTAPLCPLPATRPAC